MIHNHGGTVYEIARQLDVAPGELIDFSANINPLGFSPRVKKVITNSTEALLHYPDQEAHHLISALSTYHNLPRDCILQGNGSTEFIFLIPRILKPERILIVVPTFSEYEASLAQVNGTIRYFMTVEEDYFRISISKLIEELGNGYDALYICNPGNPTGVLTGYAEMKEIVKNAWKRSVRVIVDETFIDFNENQSLKHEVQQYENLYILRSMTKFYALPGLRAGYLISCRSNIQNIRTLQEPWTMNAVAQNAASVSLQDSVYIKKTINYVAEARNSFIDYLKEIPCITVFPGSANYLLLKLLAGAPCTVDEMYEQLLKKKIIIRKCGNFQGLDQSFFRIAVRKKSENKRLVSELKKIIKV